MEKRNYIEPEVTNTENDTLDKVADVDQLADGPDIRLADTAKNAAQRLQPKKHSTSGYTNNCGCKKD